MSKPKSEGFDALTREIAGGGASRRDLVKGTVAAAIGGLGFAGLRAAAGPATAGAQAPPDEAERTVWMFIQSARRGSLAKKRRKGRRLELVLDGAHSHTIGFTDRPVRDVGIGPNRRFFTGLGFGEKNPPNAALVGFDEEGREHVEILELFRPRYSRAKRQLRYEAKPLRTDDHRLAEFNAAGRHAAFPKQFEHATLFIDDCTDKCVACVHVNFGDLYTYMGACWRWSDEFGCYVENCDQGSPEDQCRQRFGANIDRAEVRDTHLDCDAYGIDG